MKNFLLSLTVLFILQNSFAGTVDTIIIRSNSMQKDIKCVVIKPATYKKKKKNTYPVVYLLHGYSGSYNNWIKQEPDLIKYADDYQLIIVCPDGEFSSWYIDSPVDSTMKFETYVGKEIPEAIDKLYRTIPNRKARAVTGLSMGGHGGLFLGLRHSDIFGACGSMSGGVDLRPFPKNWHLLRRLGDTIIHADNWKNYSVINVIDQHKGDSSKIIFDCGTEDFFYDVNKALHEKMLRLKIQHDYIERPGKHDWNYWRNAVKYQLLFFKTYFEGK
ncbi:MAG: esterase family protein [Bacteroidetes bacterium]|nr:MAG: esterase family protein [Bacteroidota bacterium]